MSKLLTWIDDRFPLTALWSVERPGPALVLWRLRPR